MTEKFTVGHTKIRIAEDCCAGKTMREIEKTLESIVRTARQHLRAAERNGQDETLGYSAAPEMCAQHKE